MVHVYACMWREQKNVLTVKFYKLRWKCTSVYCAHVHVNVHVHVHNYML